MQLIRRIIRRIDRVLSRIMFRIRHPDVPVVWPQLIGTYYSQEGQDLFVSSILFNYLRNHPRAWIIDIGANHPEYFSNSLYFEQYHGCRTLAVDALAEFGDAWARLRPNSVFHATALGSAEGSITLRIPVEGDSMLSAVDGGVQKFESGTALEERRVPVKCLKTLLQEHAIDSAALLSIDVEGFELEVLKGIDFERVEIKAILIENNSTSFMGDESVRDFLVRKGYVFFARIGYLDDVFLHTSIMNGLRRI